jgi:hypothetical protein
MTTNKSYILILAFLGLIVISSCSDPAGPKKYPAPVYDLMATSIDSSSIGIKWQPSATETDPAFDRYVVKIVSSDGNVRWDTILRVSNPYKISGLQQGFTYTIEVYAMVKGGDLSVKTSIVWAPAYRFKELFSGVPIRLYEQASAKGCGLDLLDPEILKPRVLGLDSSDRWNVGLTIGNNLMFGSARLLGYDFKDKKPLYSEISDFYYDTPTLDIVYGTDPLVNLLFSEKLVNLTEVEPQVKSHLILIIRTREPDPSNYFNYAKILIKKIDGKFLQGTAGNRYIECELSYQKTIHIPYAKKAVN